MHVKFSSARNANVPGRDMSAHGTAPKWQCAGGDKGELCGWHDCHVENEDGESVGLGSCRRYRDLF